MKSSNRQIDYDLKRPEGIIPTGLFEWFFGELLKNNIHVDDTAYAVDGAFLRKLPDIVAPAEVRQTPAAGVVCKPYHVRLYRIVSDMLLKEV